MTQREMGVMHTYTGRSIKLYDPQPEDIDIRDILHGLRQPRFNGHTRLPYSVLAHSCVAYTLVPEFLKMPALLHDAHEAYLGDLITPIKNMLKAETNLLETLAEKFDRAIAKRFGFDWRLFKHFLLVEVDQRLLATEMLHLTNINNEVARAIETPIESKSVSALMRYYSQISGIPDDFYKFWEEQGQQRINWAEGIGTYF